MQDPMVDQRIEVKFQIINCPQSVYMIDLPREFNITCQLLAQAKQFSNLLIPEFIGTTVKCTF